MKDALFWWTGAIIWAGAAGLLAWLAFELLVGFACAVSWCRWSYRLMRTHGRAPQWRHLPKTFGSRWLEFTGYRNRGDTTWKGQGGHWRGIGDWKVVPPSAAATPADKAP